jgi:hypothetical protein
MANRSASDFGSEGTLFNLQTVHKMLPLVQRIVNDILVRQQILANLNPQQERLQRQKRDLAWAERKHRYALQDEIADEEQSLQEAAEELNQLGVVLLDPAVGRVGYPTMVNNRPAFFSWQPGEDGVHSWHFAEESVCHPIPSSWLKEISMAQ